MTEPELIATRTVELPDGSWATHGHMLPEPESRVAVTYDDGCKVEPIEYGVDAGGWQVTPYDAKPIH